MLTIGKLHLKNWLILAPMSGKTNLPFRLIIKKLGAGLVITEMISAAGLCRGQAKTHSYFVSHPAERPVAAQLFGSEPETMATSARIAAEKGMDIVDINMGCPVKKVVKTGSGAALMRDTKKAAKIISAARQNTSLPLTVKIRAGWSPEEANALEIAKIIEDSGADGISIHPRFASQGFSGKADWTLIARIKEALKIPVIGSGDITEPSLALKMRSVTSCDGVMIGRAALSNPWIFKQILDMEEKGSFTIPDLGDRYRLITEHYSHLIEYLGENRATYVIRGLLLLYTKSLPNRRFLRDLISEIDGREKLISVLDKYFGYIRGEMASEG
ncbi:MAG: tRNA dihydrouridine synthase DusB [Desulfatiglandales bacterium]